MVADSPHDALRADLPPRRDQSLYTVRPVAVAKAGQGTNVFADLGLSERAERLLRALVVSGPVSTRDLATSLELDLADAEMAVAELRATELADVAADGSVYARPATPRVASLVDERMTRLAQALLEARRLDLSAQPFSPFASTTSAADVTATLHGIYDSPSDVWIRSADHRSCADLVTPVIEYAARRRATPPRVVTDAIVGDDEGISADLIVQACDLRINVGLAPTFVVAGETVVLVDAARHRALVVREIGVADVARAYFAVLHERAFPHAPGAGGGHPELPAATLMIVRLLASGMKDEALARRLGISRRSVQRHVDRAMVALGATTRFQLGIEACRAALI